MGPNVVVLGCGLGGLTASTILSRQLLSRGTVTIVEPQSKIPFPPAFEWLALGWRDQKQIQRDVKKIARRKNVRTIPERVEKIDVNGRSVKTQSQEIQFDKLVVALGAELALDDVPGLEAYSHIFYNLDGALKLRDAIEAFQGGNILVGVCGTPFKCPVAPYEFSLLLEEHVRRAKKNATIQLFTPEPHPVPAAGTVIGKQVERLLSSRGVKYLPKSKPSRIEKNKIVLDGGAELTYDLLVAVPPHRSPKVVVDAGLAQTSGWIPVNPQNLATKFEDVYAIGDVASVETPHGHTPFLPKAGVFAQGQAEVVANNIAVSITGKGHVRQWNGTGSCHLQVTKSESALLRGSFLSNPPRLEFHPPSRKWFLDKVKRERDWLA